MCRKSKKLLKKEMIAKLDLFQEKWCDHITGICKNCRECVFAFENHICTLNYIKFKILKKK